MSKNILVEIGEVDVTSKLINAEKTKTYGESVTKYDFEFTKDVYDLIAVSNSNTVTVYLDSSTPPTTKVFSGFVDLFKPEDGQIKITAKDELAALINKQIMHEYDSSVPGDAAYPDGKISNIFADIVVTFGGLTTISSAFVGTLTCQDSGTDLVLTKFICRNADPFERCKKLAETLDWVFYYKASEDKVFFEPKNYTTNANILTVGTEIVELPTWEYDRSEMINDLRLEGAQQLVQGTQFFTGDGSTTVFTLSNIPVATAVYYSSAKNYASSAKLAGEILVGDVPDSISTHAYELDKKKKTVAFTSFTPANDADNNILAEVTYYAPIPVHLQESESKTLYGTYAKTIILTDVITLEDAWKRGENLLSVYNKPFKSAKIKVKWTNDLDLEIGQSIRIVDSINEPNVDEYLTIYKIIDLYPQNIVELEVGDRQFTIEEYQANLIERVKRLEETVIGTTDAVTEIVQNEIQIDVVPESVTVLIEDINDSFILGHPNNAILGIGTGTPLGNRSTLSTTTTYTKADW